MTPSLSPGKSRYALIPAALISLIAVAGCGGGNQAATNTGPSSAASAPSTSAAAPSGAAETVRLQADEDGGLYFNKKKLTAKGGKVTLVMKNPSSTGIMHGIAVEGNGVDKDGNTVGKGGVSKVSVDLKPGKYEFYCPFDQHKQKGMKGTLTVT